VTTPLRAPTGDVYQNLANLLHRQHFWKSFGNRKSPRVHLQSVFSSFPERRTLRLGTSMQQVSGKWIITFPWCGGFRCYCNSVGKITRSSSHTSRIQVFFLLSAVLFSLNTYWFCFLRVSFNSFPALTEVLLHAVTGIGSVSTGAHFIMSFSCLEFCVFISGSILNVFLPP